MAKPFILALDDDTNVLRAVERDLRKQYHAQYRIVRAYSGEAALELLHELKRRDDPAALFLVDQRMPKMTGVEFLEKGLELYPQARRVLLTAYADTDAAIRAINNVQIDYYLLKPWDPPEEKLYPVVTDLLNDWRSTYRPPFEGIRVVGNQWSPATHQVKDFLARNSIPYLWLDPEVNDEARRLIEASGLPKLELPCLFFADGSILQKPENREIAERVGLQTSADKPFYDLIIVGGANSAGQAAMYFSRFASNVTLLIRGESLSKKISQYLIDQLGRSARRSCSRPVCREFLWRVMFATVRSRGWRPQWEKAPWRSCMCTAIWSWCEIQCLASRKEAMARTS